MYPKLGLFIDGEWLNGSGRKTETVINPLTETALAELPHAGKTDLDRALAAAKKGFEIWRKTSAWDRARVMSKAAELVRERAEAIAAIITQEQGKPVGEARLEVIAAADVIQWMGEEGKRSYGRVIPSRLPGTRTFTTQEPVGISAAFTPWNFPALSPTRKIAGALGGGCALILKPSEETPGAVVEVTRAFEEAGLPAGVLNVVFGVPAEISEYLIAQDEVRKISFTGSIAVGKHLTKLAAAGVKRVTMELGGHSPVVVFDDVDPEKIADFTVGGKFRNAGQVCISPTRFFVQENSYKKFAARFVEKAKAVRLGNGLEKDTQMGPLANARRLEAMASIVAGCQGSGAKIAAGGTRRGNQGYFFEPTVITDIEDDSKLMTQEPFGPIAPIIPFKNFDEVVARANSLEYGLAAYAFTNSTKTANAIGDALQAGMVGINTFSISMAETPFGGVKESGYGHEGSVEGLEAYTSKKFISQA
jgi:succinate-semialdehyde dehydrogenase/glutarate-semialdehyde dehydrogenase